MKEGIVLNFNTKPLIKGTLLVVAVLLLSLLFAGTAFAQPVITHFTAVPALEAEVGQEITWTAHTTGADQWAFYVYRDGNRVHTRWWSGSHQVSYTPDATGSYSVRGFARFEGANAVWRDSEPAHDVIVSDSEWEPLAISAVNDPVGPVVGDPAVWSVEVVEGSGDPGYQYAFYIFRGGSRVFTQWWSDSDTVTYIPTEETNHKARAFVRDSKGAMVWADSLGVDVGAGTADPYDFDFDLPLPSGDVDEEKTWSITAQGGTPPYQYAFYIFRDGSRVLTQWWSGSNEVKYTPLQPEPVEYYARAFVRDANGVMIWKNSGPSTFEGDPAVEFEVVDVEIPGAAGDDWEWEAVLASGDPTDANDYAFYVYKDGKRVLTRWWLSGAEAHILNYEATDVGEYYVRAFARDDEKTVWFDSAKLKVDILNTDQGRRDTTIQAAVDNAEADDTIMVGPGTYQEQVVVNKDLTLTGVGEPKILAPATPATYMVEETSATFEPVVFAFGGTLDGNKAEGEGMISFNLSGFTVDGDARVPVAQRSAAVLLRNVNSSSVSDNKLQNMALLSKQTFGLLFYGDGVLTVENNQISGYQRGGIGIIGNADGTGPFADIIGNIVTAPPVAANWAPNGIQIGWGAGGNIVGNTVRSSEVDSPDWAASAILIPGSSSIVISNNTVYGSDIGIGIAGYGNFLGGRQLSDNNLITGNTVYECYAGIAIQGDVKDTVITGNNVYGNVYGAYSYDFAPTHWSGGGVPVETVLVNNKIHSNTYGFWIWNILEANEPAPAGFVVDAEKNWWGFASGPYNADLNPAGDGNMVGATGNVLFIPWWEDEDMTTEGYPPVNGDSVGVAGGMFVDMPERPSEEELNDLAYR